MSARQFAVCLFLALPNWAGAQTTDAATRELIERLLSRIDTLEKRVAQLENSGARAAAPTTPTAAPAVPTVETVQTTHQHDAPPLPDAGRSRPKSE